jgi:hypothetical protein
VDNVQDSEDRWKTTSSWVDADSPINANLKQPVSELVESVAVSTGGSIEWNKKGYTTSAFREQEHEEGEIVFPAVQSEVDIDNFLNECLSTSYSGTEESEESKESTTYKSKQSKTSRKRSFSAGHETPLKRNLPPWRVSCRNGPLCESTGCKFNHDAPYPQTE